MICAGLDDNDESIVVTHADGNNVVIITESEWESRNDTVHLLRSPENAKRLLSARKQVDHERELSHSSGGYV